MNASIISFFSTDEKQDTAMKVTVLRSKEMQAPTLQATGKYRTGLHGTEINGTEMQATGLHETEIHETELHGTEMQATEMQAAKISACEMSAIERQVTETQSTNIQPIDKKSVIRQGLLFYNESDSGPLQGNFAELNIDTNLSITANLTKLDPARDSGILIYLTNVKLPQINQALIFQNEFMNINRHGVMIWVQDIIGVVAVNLHFDLLQHRVMFGSDIFENPIIYKGKTHLTHSMVKPEKWGVLKSIEVLELDAS